MTATSETRTLTPAGAAYAARYAADGKRGMLKLPLVIAAMLALGVVTVLLVGSIDLAGLLSNVCLFTVASLWAAAAILEHRRLERVVIAARDDTTLRWSVVARTVVAARDGVPRPELTFRTFAHVLTEAAEL